MKKRVNMTSIENNTADNTIRTISEEEQEKSRTKNETLRTPSIDRALLQRHVIQNCTKETGLKTCPEIHKT